MSRTALLIHGLNQKPDLMGEWEPYLTDLGYSKVRVLELAGLEGNTSLPHRVDHRVWVEQLKGLKQEVDTQEGLDIFGYSLGGLVALSAHEEGESINYYLFQPALGVSFVASLYIEIMMVLPENMLIPSFSPLEQRARHFLNAGIYKQLGELYLKRKGIKDLKKSRVRVFFDPKDPLLSKSEIMRTLDESDLLDCELHLVRANHINPHCAYSPDRLTRSSWELVKSQILGGFEL
jgi:hypothetical protein